MDNTKKLLMDIYEGASMGKETIRRMIKRCADENFKKAIADQFAEYHELCEKARSLMEEKELPQPSQNAFAGLAYTSLYLNLNIDRTSSHMAEMLMQGSLMGITDIARSIRENPDADDDARVLAKKLLSTEERNLRDMEAYL